jgi:hypothetical protein
LQARLTREWVAPYLERPGRACESLDSHVSANHHAVEFGLWVTGAIAPFRKVSLGSMVRQATTWCLLALSVSLLASGWAAPRAGAACGDYVIFVGSSHASQHAAPVMAETGHSQSVPARGPVCRGGNCRPTDEAPPRAEQPRPRDAGMPLASSSWPASDRHSWQNSEPGISLCVGFRWQIKRPPRV